MDVTKDDYENSAKTTPSLQGAALPPDTSLMAWGSESGTDGVTGAAEMRGDDTS